MKERSNELAVILVFLSRGQSFVRPSEDVEKIEMALERKKVPHPWFKRTAARVWERNPLWREHMDLSFCRPFTCTQTRTHYRKVCKTRNKRQGSSLESVLSGLSEHDEDEQSHLSVQGERDHFVQHDDKTLKRGGRNKVSTSSSSPFISSSLLLACECLCIIYLGIAHWHDEDGQECEQWHESFRHAGGETEEESNGQKQDGEIEKSKKQMALSSSLWRETQNNDDSLK